MTIEDIDLIMGGITLILTLMVYSYLLGDNFLYRIAVHILVGAAAGYILIAAFEQVIIPWVNNTLSSENRSSPEQAAALTFGVIPIIFATLLLAKNTTRFSGYGNILFIHVLLGIGTGIAIIGALIGTVLPLLTETAESVNQDDQISAYILILGTLCTLFYFQYLGREFKDTQGNQLRRGPLSRLLRLLGRSASSIGQAVIAITLGALYAGAILTSMTIFTRVVNEQVRFLLDQVGG